MSRSALFRLASAAVIATVAVAGLAYTLRAEASLRAQSSAQQRTTADLEKRLAVVEARQALDVDWRSTAANVQLSVVTIDAGNALGSAWVARTDASGSDLITNFHVVEDAWKSGVARVTIRRGDGSFPGTIVRVDVNDDLAVIHVTQRLLALSTVTARPKVGTMVMAVGSPLGLSGTISVGVVSGYRSLEGSDYVQFSAAISPGNSGGPVVDGQGHVVAVASAKLVGNGVEGLSLGIPVQVACAGLVVCSSV
ncbi:MAG TPA: serine protease [Candidatus Dormibacteraeota bacterium]|nr:serine protease [Candidatus Dormibacteraeota bacterium]